MNGLYVVDVEAVKRGNSVTIKQDYLVQWRDGREPEVTYFSGIPKARLSTRPDISQPIADFCGELRNDGQYGCPDHLDHHYADELDVRLPQKAPWPKEFAAAMSLARASGAPKP